MKKLFLFLTILFVSVNSFALKILIVEKNARTQVTASGAFNVIDTAKNKKYKVKEGGTFTVMSFAKGSIRAGSVSSEGNIIITPRKKTTFKINGNGYTGKLIIKPAGDVFNIIEETNMEEYLYGVLPYEMSYNWPIEALKAQAVAARTYTAKTLEDSARKDFDLYSDVRSQMYKGSAKVYASVREAVDNTKGQILEYNGKMFYTYYHANCGGHTDPLPWGGAVNNIKPLNGAKCASCGTAATATWTRTIPQADIEKFTTKKGLKGSVTNISVAKKTSHGRAASLNFKTKNATKSFNCNDFRLAVGSSKFRSCYITSVKKDSKGFTFSGRGYGHGTGMCQEGAKTRATNGEDYKKILNTYYPGAKIKKL